MLGGMNHYKALRRRALDRYRSAIAAAKREYNRALRHINELQDAMGTPSRRVYVAGRSIIDAVADTCPRDRLFSVADVFKLLSAVDAYRPTKRSTVKTYMSVLEKEGRVYRVSKVRRTVLYAVKGFKTPESAFGAKSLWQVSEALIQQYGALRIEELVVKMHELNYRTDCSRPRLKRSLYSVLLKHKRFRLDERQRWDLV